MTARRPAETPGWRGFLRRPALGWVLLAAAVVSLFLLWQQLAGRPLKRTFRAEGLPADTVKGWRFPKPYEASDWNNAAVRITRAGKPLPQFATQSALEASGREGFVIKGREVLFKAAAAGGDIVVETPWTIRWKTLLILLAAVAAAAVVLRRAENPVLVAWHRRSATGLALAARWGIPLLALGAFTAAVLIRIYGFSFPYWANDTGSYFESILSVMRGGAPISTPDRPFAYPLAFGLVLRAAADFKSVLAMHAVATFVAAIAVGAVIWLTARRLFPQSPALRALTALVAVAAFCAIALNERILQREWAMLAEAWAAIYIGIQAALAWWLLARARPLWASLLIFAGLCAAGLLTFFTKSNWGFALAGLPIPWLAATWLNARGWRQTGSWLLAGAAVLLTLTFVGFKIQSRCNRAHGLENLYDRSRAMIAWHVYLVRPEIERRLRTEPNHPDAPVLREIGEACDRALAREDHGADGAYPSFGYDPDALFYTGIPEGPLFKARSQEERTRICFDLFFGALGRNPGGYISKVLTQLGNLFENPYQRPTTAYNRVKLALERSETASRTQPIPPGMKERYAAEIARAKAEFARPWPSPARQAMSDRAVVIADALNTAFPWMLALPALVLGVAAAWRRWRDAIPWRVVAPVATIVLWATASVILNALSSAATQGLDVLRYIELSIPLTVLAQFLWPLLALSLLLAWRNRAQTAAHA